jgi:hypothetical protein
VLVLVGCLEKETADDRLPLVATTEAEDGPSRDVPPNARWGWSSSSSFDEQVRYSRPGAVIRRRFEDTTLQGEATVLTLRSDGSYAWGWMRRTGMAESTAWERGDWHHTENELRLTPRSQQLDEAALNTVRPSSREDVDLTPRAYTVTALTLHAGDAAREGIRLLGPTPPWTDAKQLSVELQRR